jgi:hypothetical protein
MNTPTPTVEQSDPVNRDPARAARIALIGSQLVITDLDDSERSYLATCQMIYREDSGSKTPFQSFLVALVFAVEHGKWPAPEDVLERLEEFTLEYNDLAEEAAKFLRRYPQNATQETEETKPWSAA